MKRGTFDVLLIGGLIFAICLFFVVFILAAPNIAEKDRIEHTCPYGDVQGLDKNGGIITYSDGADDKTFVVVNNYQRVDYKRSTDVLEVYHSERVLVGHWNRVSYVDKHITDLTINGWQIKSIEVKE